MLSHKKSLNILKKTNALLEGHFILSSGLHSPKYIQCAKLLSFPHLAKDICNSLAKKIKKKFKSIDLILAPAMGGVIIGYEIGKLLKKETIFCERVNGKFALRRGFHIKKGRRHVPAAMLRHCGARLQRLGHPRGGRARRRRCPSAARGERVRRRGLRRGGRAAARHG